MNTLVLIDGLTALLQHALEINATIAKARAEGRDVTDAEVDEVLAKNDAAKAALDAAIKAARDDPNA